VLVISSNLYSANKWRRSAIALSVLLLAVSLIDTHLLTRKCVLQDPTQSVRADCWDSCHNQPVARGLLVQVEWSWLLVAHFLAGDSKFESTLHATSGVAHSGDFCRVGTAHLIEKIRISLKHLPLARSGAFLNCDRRKPVKLATTVNRKVVQLRVNAVHILKNLWFHSTEARHSSTWLMHHLPSPTILRYNPVHLVINIHPSLDAHLGQRHSRLHIAFTHSSCHCSKVATSSLSLAFWLPVAGMREFKAFELVIVLLFIKPDECTSAKIKCLASHSISWVNWEEKWIFYLNYWCNN